MRFAERERRSENARDAGRAVAGFALSIGQRALPLVAREIGC